MTATEIKLIRERKRWTQKDLAAHIGYSFEMVAKWEQGREQVSNRASKLLKTIR